MKKSFFYGLGLWFFLTTNFNHNNIDTKSITQVLIPGNEVFALILFDIHNYEFTKISSFLYYKTLWK